MLVVALALVSGFLFALGSALQQSAAMAESRADALRLRLLLHLVRRRRWLLGIACDLAGFGVQVLALKLGELVVVQPLLVSTLIFGLPIGARVSSQSVGPRETRGAVTVAIGLALYISILRPEASGEHSALVGWIAGGAITCGILLALGIGGLRSEGATRAALLGTGAGVLFGVASALTKAVVDLPELSAIAILTSWHVYALAAFGLAGMVFAQSALQAGSLAPALAGIVAFDPIAAGSVGVALMGEQLHPSALGVVGALAGGALAFAGIVELSRSSVALRALHAPRS